MHYAVPRILYAAGLLERLFTDMDSRAAGLRWLRWLPDAVTPRGLRRIAGRYPEGVPRERTTAFNGLGIGYAVRRAMARSKGSLTAVFLRTNREFCLRVCRQSWGDARAVFTFNCAGLEIMTLARDRGMRTVSEQTIAPAAVERRLLREEQEFHPGWESAHDDRFADEYSQREQAEWALADSILCGSEFVREGILECGGPVERCVVVPYGVDGLAGRSNPTRHGPKLAGPLRVLTVGTVSLRKGAPYVLDAARRMRGNAVFRMVGPSILSPSAERELGSVVEWTGPVPRSEVAEHYAWADVFLLPSICEGSATVTYEALTYGLPVVCTPNTGSVVRDGEEGFVVPIRDSDALVKRLSTLEEDRRLLQQLGERASKLAADFTMGRYGERLLATLAPLTA